jgi:hypothetical protein
MPKNEQLKYISIPRNEYQILTSAMRIYVALLTEEYGNHPISERKTAMEDAVSLLARMKNGKL